MLFSELLEVILQLECKQGDVTAAFLHANIPKDKNLYVQIPQGFQQYGTKEHRKVLKFKKTLIDYTSLPENFRNT